VCAQFVQHRFVLPHTGTNKPLQRTTLKAMLICDGLDGPSFERFHTAGHVRPTVVLALRTPEQRLVPFHEYCQSFNTTVDVFRIHFAFIPKIVHGHRSFLFFEGASVTLPKWANF
jgi:hypothetical protein